MKLKSTSINWAMKNVLKEGDTDLFPRPFELQIIKACWSTLRPDIEKIDINTHAWEGPRRVIVPKSDLAFRSASQLDPIDSILFAAIIKEIGAKIEKRRMPPSSKRVFSYRFAPLAAGSLYQLDTGWEEFWKTSSKHCDRFGAVLVTDIVDFYNQIYHHVIENQLDLCGIKKEYKHAIKNLLANTTEGVSRGVPIGPHPSHLLAELAFIPIDNFLDGLGVTFCRYVDDIHIFCEDADHAHTVLFQIAEYVDRTKLQLSKQKTKIYSASEFKKLADTNVTDRPINELEEQLLKTLKSHTAGPYQKIRFNKLSDDDVKKLSKQNIENVLEAYLKAKEVDYLRLRWFLRRLSQVGVPGGVEFIIKNFDRFLPAIADTARYLESASANYKGAWKDIGKELLAIYNTGIVQASEYLRIVILSLFARIKGINHVSSLTAMYQNSSPSCQRKILLAAARAGANDWLSNLKSAYKTADPWTRRALIYSMKALPDDERQFWLKSVKRRVAGLDACIATQIA